MVAMVPQRCKTLDPSFLVLNACISTWSIRLLACQHFGQERIEQSINGSKTRKYSIHCQTCTHKLVLVLSSQSSLAEWRQVDGQKRDPGEDHLQTRPNTTGSARPLRSESDDAIRGSRLYQCTIMRNPMIGTCLVFRP